MLMKATKSVLTTVMHVLFISVLHCLLSGPRQMEKNTMWGRSCQTYSRLSFAQSIHSETT